MENGIRQTWADLVQTTDTDWGIANGDFCYTSGNKTVGLISKHIAVFMINCIYILYWRVQQYHYSYDAHFLFICASQNNYIKNENKEPFTFSSSILHFQQHAFDKNILKNMHVPFFTYSVFEQNLYFLSTVQR